MPLFAPKVLSMMSTASTMAPFAPITRSATAVATRSSVAVLDAAAGQRGGLRRTLEG